MTNIQYQICNIQFPSEGSEQVVEAVLSKVTNQTKLAMIDTVTSPTGLRMPFEELWSEVFSLLKPQELFITRGAKGLCFGNSRKRSNLFRNIKKAKKLQTKLKLVNSIERGYVPYVLFLTQIQDIKYFKIAKDIDNEYYKNYLTAKKKVLNFWHMDV